ncbi:chalcone isomerase family protein [Massilia sp. W12]|uniref:chalcone isomerase family protein n=1 Tax=Massilia sp. W12 TaxID=3126507 RepID=UPI0030CD8FC9
MFATFCWKNQPKYFLCLALCFLMSAPALAWRHELPQAKLLGSGEFRWFGLRIYEARLYAAHAPFDPARSFALELTYQRNISKERFVQASLDEMRRIFGASLQAYDMARWQSWMEQAFADVSPGMQLTGVFVPGFGCRFYLQNALRAEIADPVFAQHFFAIWLHENSRDQALRRQLLGSASQAPEQGRMK